MAPSDRLIHMDPATRGDRLARPHSTATVVAVDAEGLRQRQGKRRQASRLLLKLSNVHSVPKLSGPSTTGSDTKSLCTCLSRGGCVPHTGRRPSIPILASCHVSSAVKPIRMMHISKPTTIQPAKNGLPPNERFTEKITSTNTCVWFTTSSFRTGL